MSNEKIINDIENKYQQFDENPETYLKGLLHAKPINYWDYVEVDTLLSLQKPRTNFKDEEIFIMYHQVTELFLKMIVHEIKQLVYDPYEESVWLEKLERLNRYTNMLIGSFDVMKYGMNYDDYNTFRSTLTPASGFQSVTFRLIEIYCTRLANLINEEGKKSLTLLQFEEKYLDRLIAMANKTKGSTLEDKVLNMPNCSDTLRAKLKEFDHLYNVAWPLVHLETAQHYLDLKGENKAATGGSEWKKYLHPKFQQRKFFPTLWGNEEITNWGNKIKKNNLL